MNSIQYNNYSVTRATKGLYIKERKNIYTIYTVHKSEVFGVNSVHNSSSNFSLLSFILINNLIFSIHIFILKARIS